VARSSGFDDLDNAAAAAAASWHYIPAMVGSARVSDWLAVKFHFAAQDPQQPAPPADVPGSCT
jgi:outer membrane biosynthesis protein TonB